MAATVEFNVREIDAVKRMLAKVSLDSGERQSFLNIIGDEVETQTKKRFDTKLDPAGNTWAALAQKTLDYYAEEGFAGAMPPLVKKGRLQDSVTYNVEGGSWSVLVGATMEYAATHQFGATITPKKAPYLSVPGYGKLKQVTIPARPYLGISAGDAGELADLTALFLARRIK